MTQTVAVWQWKDRRERVWFALEERSLEGVRAVLLVSDDRSQLIEEGQRWFGLTGLGEIAPFHYFPNLKIKSALERLAAV